MEYRTHVFDCDGVLLDSNRAKEQAFYDAALPYGKDKAEALVAYHRTAGAIGRRARVDYFFDHILGQEETDEEEADMMMASISLAITRALERCSVVRDVRPYLQWLRTSGATLVVVSGVEQGELSRLLATHNLDRYFDAVFGTSDKLSTLYSLRKSGVITPPAIYYGDTSDDWRAAQGAGMEGFALISGYSTDPTIQVARDFSELL